MLDVAGSGTNMNGEGSFVNASVMRTRGKVDIAGTCVSYCCVSEGEGRWMANRLDIFRGGVDGCLGYIMGEL